MGTAIAYLISLLGLVGIPALVVGVILIFIVQYCKK